MCSVPTAGHAQNRLSIPNTVQKSTGALDTNNRGLSARFEQTEVVEISNRYLLPPHSGAHRHGSFPSQSTDTLNLLREGWGITNKVSGRQQSQEQCELSGLCPAQSVTLPKPLPPNSSQKFANTKLYSYRVLSPAEGMLTSAAHSGLQGILGQITQIQVFTPQAS